MPGMWRPKITASTPQRVVIGRTDSMRSGGQCNRPEGPKVALCLRRGLPSAAHEPLLDRSAAALGIEPDQKDIVELADELGFGSVLEVAAPSMSHRQIALDRDWLVPSFVDARRGLVLQPGSDD